MDERDLLRYMWHYSLVRPAKNTREGQVKSLICKFRCASAFLRMTANCESQLKKHLLPSINGVLLKTSHPQAFRKAFGHLLQTEEDRKLCLRFSEASASYAVSNKNFPLSYNWGLDALRVRELWRYSIGERVKVAVVDTGIDMDHPDLQYALAGGVNILQPSGALFDDNGHGTHIAGTVAASHVRSMVGVAPGVALYAVKAFDRDGSAYISDIVKAIDWCIAHRIDIMNMSFGMHERSMMLFQAVQKAAEQGVIVIASAGNGGLRYDVDAPARYDGTISVGALRRDGHVAPFSKLGLAVDLYAPGDQIVSTWPGGMYKHLSGSSMATAHVSGVVALLRAVRPEMPHPMLRDILQANTHNRKLDAMQAWQTMLAYPGK